MPSTAVSPKVLIFEIIMACRTPLASVAAEVEAAAAVVACLVANPNDACTVESISSRDTGCRASAAVRAAPSVMMP